MLRWFTASYLSLRSCDSPSFSWSTATTPWNLYEFCDHTYLKLSFASNCSTSLTTPLIFYRHRRTNSTRRMDWAFWNFTGFSSSDCPLPPLWVQLFWRSSYTSCPLAYGRSSIFCPFLIFSATSRQSSSWHIHKPGPGDAWAQIRHEWFHNFNIFCEFRSDWTSWFPPAQAW